MKFKMFNFFLSLIIVSCVENSNSVIKNESSDSISQFSKDRYLKSTKYSVKSGMYNNIKLAFADEYVTGTFEFYDKWNSTINDYENTSVFYFYGKTSKGEDTITIISKWPGDDFLIRGKLILFTKKDSIKLLLDDQPNGYAAYDLKDEGYSSALLKVKKWNQIRIIKNQKVFLQQNKDSLTSKKGIYIVKDDIVEVLNQDKQESFVEYVAYKSGKSYFGWVKNSDFYSLNPEEW